MTYFKNKTVIMSGGSRGVGLEIAKALGKDGANIAILAKTTEPHPTLPGTIFTAADEIEEVGGTALPIVCDIRYEDQVEAAVEETVNKFGGIDICINNASAIHLTDTVNTPMKRYDLMHNINVRGRHNEITEERRESAASTRCCQEAHFEFFDDLMPQTR